MEVGRDFLASKMGPDSKILDFVNTLSFGQVFSETKQGNSVKNKFLKVDDQVYKFVSDNEDTSNDFLDNDLLKKSETVKPTYDDISGRDDDDTAKSKDESDKPKVQSQPIHHGIALNLLVLNKNSFINALPKALRSFIHDTVEIIKSKGDLFNDTTYKFSFKEIDLHVIIKEIDQKTVIRIELASSDLKDKLFTEENSKNLLQALQRELVKDDIELEIVYTDSSNFHSQDQNSEQDNHSQNEKENLEEDPT